MTQAFGHRGPLMSNIAFAAMWSDPTLSVADMGERLGISAAAVSHRARRRKLELRCSCPRLTRNLGLFDAMWNFGVKPTDIAEHFGCHANTPARLARSRGLALRGRGKKMTVRLVDFQAHLLVIAMKAEAKITRAAMYDAEMVDGARPRKVNKRKSRAKAGNQTYVRRNGQ